MALSVKLDVGGCKLPNKVLITAEDGTEFGWYTPWRVCKRVDVDDTEPKDLGGYCSECKAPLTDIDFVVLWRVWYSYK